MNYRKFFAGVTVVAVAAAAAIASAAAPPSIIAVSAEAKPAIPRGNPGSWVTNDDYPTGALRNERQGTTQFLLTVDEAGRPISCTIRQSSGSSDLDEATCALITTRARFFAARDADGHPTRGTYASAVRWVIPREPLQPGTIVMSGLLGTNGKYTDCRIEHVEGAISSPIVGFTTCPAMYESPVEDANGNRVARRIRRTMTVEVLPP